MSESLTLNDLALIALKILTKGQPVFLQALPDGIFLRQGDINHLIRTDDLSQVPTPQLFQELLEERISRALAHLSQRAA